jgi:hypothetical protein
VQLKIARVQDQMQAAPTTSEFDLLCQVIVEDSLWLDSFRSGTRTGSCKSPPIQTDSKEMAQDSKMSRISSCEKGSEAFDNITRSKPDSGKRLPECSSSELENRPTVSPTSVANESIDLLKRAASIVTLGKRIPDNARCEDSAKKQRAGSECGGIPVQSLLN